MPQYMPGLLETATNLYEGSLYHLALGFDVPDPNAHGCTRLYGHPIPPACRAALRNLPHGELPTIFTTRRPEASNNYVKLPQRFADVDKTPACVISIDLDGQSKKDVFVSVPWNIVRNITEHIIERCVDGPGMGGWETFGIKRAFDAVINPPEPSPDANLGTRPAGVVDPDGTVTTVGFPQGVVEEDPPSLEIPAYMVITVAAPRARPSRDRTDYVIGLNLREYLRQKYEYTRDIDILRGIARAHKALSLRFVSDLMRYNHPRWWEFRLGPLAPEPTNIDYTCDSKLGSPNIGNCEALLFEFVRDGEVVLDPAAGPVIKTSGDCAIGISSKVQQVMSWDILRNLAQHLIVSCVASPITSAIGGRAVAKPVRGRRKRMSLSPFSRRDTPITTPLSSIEMSVYLQPPFSGAPDDTCPWKVASSHTGDIRQCPATTSPYRPPERELSANGIIAEGTNATIVQSARGGSPELVSTTLSASTQSIASPTPLSLGNRTMSSSISSATASIFTIANQLLDSFCTGAPCPTPTGL